MTAITFDTHEFVKKLRSAGFSEEQAEVITDLQKNTINVTLEQARHDYELDNLATKRDLREIELKIETVRSDLKRDIAELKTDLSRWVLSVVVGVGVLQTALMTALLLRLAGTI